jgi:hypothetical protein
MSRIDPPIRDIGSRQSTISTLGPVKTFMQKITAILFAAIIEAVPTTTIAYAQQTNTTSAICLDIAVTLIYLDSLDPTLNEEVIFPNRTFLLQNLNNLFSNPIDDCPNLNQGLTDYLEFDDFTQGQP